MLVRRSCASYLWLQLNDLRVRKDAAARNLRGLFLRKTLPFSRERCDGIVPRHDCNDEQLFANLSQFMEMAILKLFLYQRRQLRDALSDDVMGERQIVPRQVVATKHRDRRQCPTRAITVD